MIKIMAKILADFGWLFIPLAQRGEPGTWDDGQLGLWLVWSHHDARILGINHFGPRLLGSLALGVIPKKARRDETRVSLGYPQAPLRRRRNRQGRI